MALSKVDFNNINVTPAASKALKWNSSANGFETGDLSGNMVLLSTFTSDGSDDTADFTSGIDSTYKEYQFHFTDIHPETDQKNFTFQVDTGTNTNYNQTITSSFFYAYHNEGDSNAVLEYFAGADQAQGTGFQLLSEATGNVADECVCGILHLFEPSSSTFLKHFMARTQAAEGTGHSGDSYAAGYINTTTAITRVRFKFVSGEIQSGTIKMYGIL
jgi:hypothetical protein